MPRPHRKTIAKAGHRPDLLLLFLVGTLIIIGLVFVYEASVVEAYLNFSDQLHFVKLQLKWVLLGLLGFTGAALTPLPIIKRLAFPSFVLSLFLLLLVLIPGIGNSVQGAQRWILIGSFTIQPAEIAKLSLIIYLAALFEKQTKPSTFFASLGLLTGLIMLQPDLGTTISLTAIGFVIFFASGAPLKTILISSLGMIFAALTLILSSSYRRDRLLTFLDPGSDPLGSSYHIRQIIIALGSGGIFGTGFGRSLQKYQYLPEATTDSIFAVIAEETGFIGSAIIVLLYLFLALRGLHLAQHTKDRFNQLLAVGATALLSFQAFLNLSAMVALVPLTGITLPFVSYGGSSIVVSLIAAGLLTNISKQP